MVAGGQVECGGRDPTRPDPPRTVCTGDVAPPEYAILAVVDCRFRTVACSGRDRPGPRLEQARNCVSDILQF
jgi:hypothetical protein